LASSIRGAVEHARAIMLDNLVDRGTRLNPSERCSMAELSEELIAWLKLPAPGVGRIDLKDSLALVSANAIPGTLMVDERSMRIQATHELVEEILRKLGPFAEEIGHAKGVS